MSCCNSAGQCGRCNNMVAPATSVTRDRLESPLCPGGSPRACRCAARRATTSLWIWTSSDQPISQPLHARPTFKAHTTQRSRLQGSDFVDILEEGKEGVCLEFKAVRTHRLLRHTICQSLVPLSTGKEVSSLTTESKISAFMAQLFHSFGRVIDL